MVDTNVTGTPTYPSAHRETAVETVGSRRVADPYRWLEDPDSPATRTWLAAQARLYAEHRSGWALVGPMRDRLTRLTAFDHCSAPIWRDDRAFYTRRAADAEHAALVVHQDGADRVLVDPHARDPSGRTTLGTWSPSRDGRLVAYELFVGGDEQATMRIVDVDSGADLPGAVDGCRYSSVAWIGDLRAFYHARDGRGGLRIYLHRIGEPFDADPVVFGEGLADIAELDVSVSDDGGTLAVVVSSGMSAATEVWVSPLDPGAPQRVRFVRVESLQDGWSSVWPASGGEVYVLTDADAPRGRLVVVDPERDSVRTILAEDDQSVLETVAALSGPDGGDPTLLALWARQGRSRLSRHDARTGREVGLVRLPGTGYVSELTFRAEGGDQAWFTYSDPVTPETVYRYDAGTDTCLPWRSGHGIRVPDVTVDEVSYPSADGTAVRLVMMRPTARPTGPLPTILQGYGAFGTPQVADYYAAALAWVQHGGLFAVACVRGGGDEGEQWHHAGRREHKQRGIDDFVAAAEYLRDSGAARPGSLGAFGHSAGGLLVGAAMTRRPELFAAVACTAGLMDMDRYELSGLGDHWVEEFGTRTDPREREWLLGYSPYHQVAGPAAYPATLLTAFAEDTRVDPMHSRKMCAALQFASVSGRPVLLRYESGVGHGERARSGRLDYFADVLAFFAHHLGLEHPDDQ